MEEEGQEQQKSIDLQAALEGVLFMHGDAISMKRLGDLLSVDEETLKRTIFAYAESLAGEGRGLLLLVQDDKVSLVTKPSVSEITKRIAREEFDSPLTPASLETLAIIAYAGPCTRARIDYIRGVNSSFILRNLSVRGLVEKKKDAKNAQSPMYQVSMDFLRYVGAADCGTLPAYDEYKKELERLFIGAEMGEKSDDEKDGSEKDTPQV